MNLIITLTTAGDDTGPFNIYSDVDGFISAFDTNISKATLEAGFPTSNAPDGTTEIKIMSVNPLCNNSVLYSLTTTTTTSSSSSSSTTTTTTSSSSSSTSTTTTTTTTSSTSTSSSTTTTTTTAAPSLTEIELGHSENVGEACALSPQGTYYINSGSFVSATMIYTESTGITPGQTGYYSDGSVWRHWDFSTLSFIDIGSC